MTQYNVHPHQIVEVHWVDICVRSGWYAPKDAHTSKAVSVGLVGEARDDCLVIVSGLNEGELSGDVTAIPWGVITNVYIFDVTVPARKKGS